MSSFHHRTPITPKRNSISIDHSNLGESHKIHMYLGVRGDYIAQMQAERKGLQVADLFADFLGEYYYCCNNVVGCPSKHSL